ncbi:MAG TPA: ATP-binding protein, partial [Acidiferrobacteraceae bacterium]|nr:ATP-binding protein [Acidiferrobacteraceae bacterium]
MAHFVILQLPLHDEHDVVQARRRARQIAELLGFEVQDQTRIATALSEIARNALLYAEGGQLEFALDGEPFEWLEMKVSDQGPGIARLQDVLAGHYHSQTGLGMGLLGSKRLMDDFRVHTSTQGTVVVLRKRILQPSKSAGAGAGAVGRIAAALTRLPPATPLEEMKQQNRELLSALEALRRRERQLEDLNRDLEETNRGVVALYAELDEKAESLRRANDVKTRFLADMTHEFRTPLNSILSVSQMLLDQFDGPLTQEQGLQVELVRASAVSLSELVDDLLDLARIEAGKVRVRTQSFSVADLFGTLRGMLRPLLSVNRSVSLLFEEDNLAELPALTTDEGKVSQILRNFIANALKYTRQGWIRVAARAEGALIVFSVADTGTGIHPADQERIFEEFVQVGNPTAG